MRRWLLFIFVLLAASAFASAPVPKLVLPKLYGPDFDRVYGWQNGTGGFEADAAANVLTLGGKAVVAGAIKTGAKELIDAAAKTVAPAKRVSGSTVLGHYPEYANMADTLGHRRFDIPTSVWDKMTDAQRWTANQKFLDRTILRGDEILLSTPLDKVRPGSYFERELQYLQRKGFVPSADGTRMIPGGGN